MSNPRILLTGSSGYIGGRLKLALKERGYPVRLLVRTASLASSDEDLVIGDAVDRAVLDRALANIDVAYYFIHSLASSRDFSEEDRLIATHFAEAASKAKVKKIIYLGGLGSSYDALSSHLKSRHEVGEILRANAVGVQVIEFRASIVIGSGSLSFELVKALTEKLPVMVTPKWVWTKAQPIAIEDLLYYLLLSIEMPFQDDPIFEIGGKDQVSYGELMTEYAKQKGLKRWMISVPVLTPRLSGLWLGLVTPVYARVGRKLIESIINETVVHDPLALHLFPIKPMGYREAIAQAIQNEGHLIPLTRWNDAVSASSAPLVWKEESLGGRLIDRREIFVPASPQALFSTIEAIGGNRGYYFCDWLWHLRGMIDLIVGGVGFRRGRRNPERLKEGDVVDFWRVEAVSPPSLLRLKAEMKIPGRAWLEFKVEPVEGGAKVIQTALFDPAGTFGILYWYCLFPLHHLVFNGMLKGIKKWTLRSQAHQD